MPAGGASDDVAILALRNLPFVERFRFQFSSEPEALSKMRSILRRWLHHAGASDRELAEIVTACGEAATNAIEHAGAAGGAPFEVSGRLREAEVEIEVSDEGRWRPPREGDQGRGLALMRALMDTVEVSPSPQGTTVRLRRALESNGGVE